MSKSKVVIVKTTPETVIEDYARLMDLVEYEKVLDLQRQLF